MSLTKNDKQDIRLIFNEGIVELVLPQFDEIRSDIKILKEDMSILKEDVSILKEDMAILKEDVKDLQNSTNRIEMLQRSELNRVDNHELRIAKLEKA